MCNIILLVHTICGRKVQIFVLSVQSTNNFVYSNIKHFNIFVWSLVCAILGIRVMNVLHDRKKTKRCPFSWANAAYTTLGVQLKVLRWCIGSSLPYTTAWPLNRVDPAPSRRKTIGETTMSIPLRQVRIDFTRERIRLILRFQE